MLPYVQSINYVIFPAEAESSGIIQYFLCKLKKSFKWLQFQALAKRNYFIFRHQGTCKLPLKITHGQVQLLQNMVCTLDFIKD